jgi:hypothetical protein
VKKSKSNSGPFAMMLQSTFDSDKYRLVLTPFERDILWLLIRRHNGKNNGDISLGAREAAEWYGYRKTAANDALRHLEEIGFISAVHKGHLVPIAGRQNIATTWSLNFLKPKVGP